MKKASILRLCILLIISSAIKAQPYATWTKTELKLNNGIVERTIQLPED